MLCKETFLFYQCTCISLQKTVAAVIYYIPVPLAKMKLGNRRAVWLSGNCLRLEIRESVVRLEFETLQRSSGVSLCKGLYLDY